MKRLKKVTMLAMVAVCCACIMQACGFTSNMSDEEAYNFGYYTGRAIRSAIDN